MEPESKFYTDPVLVLDFQSLYPSVMISHNFCFSTCLGKVHLLDETTESVPLCVTRISLVPGTLARLSADDQLFVAANGAVFCKREERVGMLGVMLDEILGARRTIKTAMKHPTTSPTLYRLLDARQLGLKLIANVTYGYTAASFSGRMPCVDIADAIVQTGRETLEKAIRLVQGNPRWNAKVCVIVYCI
jgi:DNA polymerase zeta